MVMCATNDGACLRDGDVGGPLVLMENGRYVVAGVAQRGSVSTKFRGIQYLEKLRSCILEAPF